MFQGTVVRRMWRTVLLASIAFSSACSNGNGGESSASAAATDSTIRVTDDAGTTVQLARPAQRIISLIPSATETLVAIGATKQIVGRTRYDVAPEVAALPSVGGGIDPSVEAIVNLHPDLVISWESDKRQAIREKLVALAIPVFILRTQDTTDIFRGIATIGRMTGRDSAATSVVTAVRDTLAAVQKVAAGLKAPSAMFVVYHDPPMTAGPNTFVGQLIGLAGGRSIFADADAQWPNVAMEEVVRRDPDVLVVPVGDSSGKALDRYRKLSGWRELRAVRTGRVVSVPSDLMNRPSPAIAQASQVMLAALHPEVALDSVRKLVAPARR